MSRYPIAWVIFIVAPVLFPTPGLAADNNINNTYIAFDVGRSAFSQSAQDILVLDGAGSSNTALGSSFSSPVAYRFTGGYRLDEDWRIELNYVDLGEADYSIQQSGFGGADESGGTRAWGWSLAGVGVLPLNDHWSLFGRVGAIDARVTLFKNASTSIGNLMMNNTSTVWKPVFGGGISWSFADNWSMHLGWDQYRQLGSSDTTGAVTVNLISLGVVYAFPLNYGLNSSN